MRRSRSAGWFAAFWLGIAAAVAGEPDDLIASLPEKAAECGSRIVSRAEAGELLRRSLAPGDAFDRDLLRLRLRNAISEEFCRAALSEVLAQRGFAPSQELAETMLRRLLAPGAAWFGELRPEAIRAAAADPARQLQLAVLAMLEKETPERLAVAPAELERAYREDQMRFYRPALLAREVVTAPGTPAGRKALEAVAARTMLGETTAAAVADDPSLVFQRMETASGSAVGWSKPQLAEERYRMERMLPLRPAGFLPFAQAAPLLRAEIGEARARAELQRMMNEYLAAHPVRFHF